MRKLRILRWMAGGRVPMCPRVSSQGACGTMQPRHGAELGGAQRCGGVGSTEVRTLPECRGTLRGAHRGRGTQRCSFRLFVNCSFTHFTHILRFLLTIDIVMVPSSPLEATLLISRKCQVTSFACYKACQTSRRISNLIFNAILSRHKGAS